MPRRHSLNTEQVVEQLNQPVDSPTCRCPWNDTQANWGLLELQVPPVQKSALTTAAASDLLQCRTSSGSHTQHSWDSAAMGCTAHPSSHRTSPTEYTPRTDNPFAFQSPHIQEGATQGLLSLSCPFVEWYRPQVTTSERQVEKNTLSKLSWQATAEGAPRGGAHQSIRRPASQRKPFVNLSQLYPTVHE